MSDTIQQGGRRTLGNTRNGTADKPLVSVLTVVWNAADTLERTIRSVKGQTYGNIEYIIVDGASTDGTLDVIKRNADQLDLWMSAKDRGIYDAMNKGIALCTGEWVAMINADDWYEPDTIERMVREAKSRPDTVNIVHGDMWIHYPNGQMRVKHAKRSGFLLKYWEMVLNHPTFFVRRSFYKGRPFDPEFRVSGDHQWTVRAYLEDPGQFHYISEALSHHSAGGASFAIPFGKALKETRRLSRSVGMGLLGQYLSMGVRVALYVPQHLKLWFNEHLASDRQAASKG